MEAELTRIDYSIAVHQLGIVKALAAYDPHIAGTPPLGCNWLTLVGAAPGWPPCPVSQITFDRPNDRCEGSKRMQFPQRSR